MLVQISIKNYALIAYSQLSFHNGLTMITGETGAGKSILLEALGLVLGKRADLTSLRNKEEKCVVEAHFDIHAYPLESFFIENDIDYEKITIIRREILPSGKSRAFVNDTPVTLPIVAALGSLLIDIHSQHQSHHLFLDAYQMQIVDALAQNTNLLGEYQQQYNALKNLKKELDQLVLDQQTLSKEQDYTTFLLNELTDAHLVDGQQESLEILQEKLSNVEFVKETLSKSVGLLNEEQYGLLSILQELKSGFNKISTIAPEYEDLYQRLISSEIELKDIAEEAFDLSEKLINDPQQLEETTSKLQTIYQLQRKHQVTTIAELLKIQEALSEQFFLSEGLEERIEMLQKEISIHQQKLKQTGKTLHQKRQAVIPDLIQQLKELLSSLGMENAQFDYKLEFSDQFYNNGMDQLDVLFSANKGMAFSPLKKSASGGEMSRIMLSIKAILARYAKLPTLIFDEIDTGVSGDVADRMGEIMKEMSVNMQVFAITHLPQVAAKGNVHFKVTKNQNADKTVSEIKELSPDERISEIAQMLSGNKITEAAVANARHLLNLE